MKSTNYKSRPPEVESGREVGTGLLALQQPQRRDPGGPARDLGRGREGGGLCQRYGGNLDPAAGVRPAGGTILYCRPLYGGSIFSFEVNGGEAEAIAILDRLEIM
jgi:hypothetical protein